MNLTTIGHIPSNNWKRVTTYSVSAAAGVALAISAVVAFGSSTSGPTSLAPSREASVLAVSREAPYETIQDYASREQAILGTLSNPLQLRASEADIAASVLSTELANYMAPVASVKASDADVLSSALSGEMAAYDFGATQPVQRQASAADIDAGILSSEMATYDWTVAAPRQVSQADIAASVLSTELATYAP
jgi:hypothetical protein